jgi:hypothetical protein
MADGNDEPASDGLCVSATSNDIPIGPRLVCWGHRFADQVFSKADLAGCSILILAQAHINGVILGQDATLDQQANGAPAPAACVDIKEDLFACGRADNERLQQPMFGDAGSKCLKASVAIGLADIAFGQAQLGMRIVVVCMKGLRTSSEAQIMGRFNLHGASPAMLPLFSQERGRLAQRPTFA